MNAKRPSWAAIRDIGAFVLGVYIILSQNAAEEPNTLMVVTGYACLGITGSGVAQRWLEKKVENHE